MSIALTLSDVLSDTLTPVSDEVAKRVHVNNAIVNVWVVDPSFTKTQDPVDRWYRFDSQEIAFPTHERSRMDDFSQKIYYLQFPSQWTKEGISKPNLLAKKKAITICESLFTKYSLMPSKVLPTKEEGIYLVYDYVNSEEDLSLIIETYNHSGTAAVVYDNINKNILYSEDIDEYNLEKAVRSFKE